MKLKVIFFNKFDRCDVEIIKDTEIKVITNIKTEATILTDNAKGDDVYIPRSPSIVPICVVFLLLFFVSICNILLLSIVPYWCVICIIPNIKNNFTK